MSRQAVARYARMPVAGVGGGGMVGERSGSARQNAMLVR